MKGVGSSAVEQARQEDERRHAAAEHRETESGRRSERQGKAERCARLSRRRTGRALAALLAAGIVLVFIAQNNHRVPTKLLWLSSSVPLAVLVLAAGLLGLAAGWVAASLPPERRETAAPAEVHRLRRRPAQDHRHDRGRE